MPASPRPDHSGIIRALTLGDRACYIAIDDGKAETRELMALMALCEREDLIDRRVKFRFEPGEVIAQSCGGDPECNETETVWLVHDVLPTNMQESSDGTR